MRLLWWMLILSRLSDWTDGFIFIRPERYTDKPAPAAVCGSNTRLQMCTDGLQGFNYKGETTMEFFNSAVEVLQTLVVALGAGLGVWDAVNLLEGYGSDNPVPMLMYDKVTPQYERRLSPLFRNLLR